MKVIIIHVRILFIHAERRETQQSKLHVSTPNFLGLPEYGSGDTIIIYPLRQLTTHSMALKLKS